MMLTGTTMPTSVTHCVNVFGDPTTTDATTTAAEKLVAALHRTFFDNMQSYLQDNREEPSLE